VNVNLILRNTINPQGDNKGGKDENNQSNLHYYRALITGIFSSSRGGCKHE